MSRLISTKRSIFFSRLVLIFLVSHFLREGRSCFSWGYTGKGFSPWIAQPKDSGWWMSEHAKFVQNSKDNGPKINAVFLGDSITYGWNTIGYSTFQTYYNTLGTANYGISGDRVEHLLWRIQNREVNWIQPHLVVLMIGTNNLNSNTDSEIAKGIFAVVQELRQRLPQSKILLLGILPRSNEKATQRVHAINQFISQLGNLDEMVNFLDMKEYFYKGNETFYFDLYDRDLLHLSSKGYEKWALVMDKLFRELMF